MEVLEQFIPCGFNTYNGKTIEIRTLIKKRDTAIADFGECSKLLDDYAGQRTNDEEFLFDSTNYIFLKLPNEALNFMEIESVPKEKRTRRELRVISLEGMRAYLMTKDREIEEVFD